MSLCLILNIAEHDHTLAADADIGADNGAEGRRGLTQLEADQHLFLHGQAKAAEFGGDRDAEEAQLLHFRNDIVGDEILPRRLVLDRDKPLGHEAADGGNELVAGFEVEGHARVPAVLD